ncbi:YopX family protein [Enterococcus sp. 5B3_DIV0040]|uniref:YopX family protein n=1 Tax=Enterococcus sp. 5B3_DIV0040 TaxID=1834182 RepID=UPI0020CEA83E|nr:YopX family protein [Enterococcus sp. 5B3_DIV0040]
MIATKIRIKSIKLLVFTEVFYFAKGRNECSMVPKFRAFLKRGGEMAKVIELNFEGSWTCCEPYVAVEGTCDLIPLRECELMWSSGLKDRNDVEIFEGDICLDVYNDVYGIVIFTNGCFICEWEYHFEDLFEVIEDVQVVGNICEDPELLELVDRVKMEK